METGREMRGDYYIRQASCLSICSVHLELLIGLILVLNADLDKRGIEQI